MGDDITIVVPDNPEPEPQTEPFNHEEIGEELLTLIETVLAGQEALNARIGELETIITELGSREYAAIEHNHDGLAPVEHRHDEFYAATEHQHETKKSKERDRPPESVHPYFRRIND